MVDPNSAMAVGLREALPKGLGKMVELTGDKVPPFDEPIDVGDGVRVTIEPPLDEQDRGTYAVSICGPMASMKSLRARIYAWAKGKGITVVFAGRISYALNAAQEWRQSAPDAKEQETAANDAYADYLELTEQDRRAAEEFGPEVRFPARVWCYLTHDKQQLDALFRMGHGVCIVSPKSSPQFVAWLHELGPNVRIDQLYVEEVTGLAQMWNTKVLHDQSVMYSMRRLAKERSRRVFGFCADFLVDDRPAILMNWLVDDRPHYVFKVSNARPHLQRNVCLFHDAVLEEKEAFGQHYDRLLACMMCHSDFRVWHTIAYEKQCIKMYTRAVQLGIRATLLIGNGDGEDKLRIMTNFDVETRDSQALFATSVVSFGVNPMLPWSACVSITGPMASGPIVHGQAAGRPGRVEPGLEFDTILWLVLDSKPPDPGEELTPWAEVEKKLTKRKLYKGQFAMKNRFSQQSFPKLLVDLAVGNEKEKMDIRNHCALITLKLIEYKPGWTLVDRPSIQLPPRVAAMTGERVKRMLDEAKPLPDQYVQKLDSLDEVNKMQHGLSQLFAKAHAKYETSDTTYEEAQREVLETCGGKFAHSHVSSTYQPGKVRDSKEVFEVRAWTIARHFSSLGDWKAVQLLTFEKHEDELNLAACHLSLGTRRVALSRQLLRDQSDQCGVGLYTHLPERMGAVEEACRIVGVSCLAVKSVELTVQSSPFVRLLQQDKMGAPSVDADRALRELRVFIDLVLPPQRLPQYGTQTLWNALRSLLACIHSTVTTVKDRRMSADETREWEARNASSDGDVQTQTMRAQGLYTASQLDKQLGFSDSDEETEDAVDEEAGAAEGTAGSSSVQKKMPRARQKRNGSALRVPTTIIIHRKLFYFLPDGSPLTESKAKSNRDARAVDVVPMWRVYSHERGESITAAKLLGGQAPLDVVERELTSLRAEPNFEQFEELPQEKRDNALVHAANNPETVNPEVRLRPREVDGVVTMEEPIPAAAFAKVLKRLREKRRRAKGRLCTPQLLDQINQARHKGEKQRLERHLERSVRKCLGPTDTARLLWCEAVESKASAADANGLRWLLVEYRVKMGLGRENASWPSLQACEHLLREEIMCSIMHDWDIVSCHFFLCQAVVRGLLGLDPSSVVSTIDRYNRACEEDVRTGRGKDENTFLKPIAEFYGVTIKEAKMGCLILLNQGTIETWLQKELDPPREVPPQQHDDMTGLMVDAICMRRLFFEHADTLFGRDAFDALKAKLLAEHPDDGSLKTRAGMERSLFGYCLQELEHKALGISMRVSAECNLPSVTRIFDGFGQLHVDGIDPATFKVEAEAALIAYFKSPIYLAEKPFYKKPPPEAAEESEDGSERESEVESEEREGGGGGGDVHSANDDDGSNAEEEEDEEEAGGCGDDESDNGNSEPDDGDELDSNDTTDEELEAGNEADSEDDEKEGESEAEESDESESEELEASNEADSEDDEEEGESEAEESDESESEELEASNEADSEDDEKKGKSEAEEKRRKRKRG